MSKNKVESKSEVKNKVKIKKRNSVNRKVSVAIVNIFAGFNNTIINISDLAGNVLCWSSAGKMKFRGAQRGTPYAAQTASEDVAKIATDKFAVKTVSIILIGPGAGREASIRGLQNIGLIITSIKDITPVLHNGCRPPKRRRV